MCDDVPNCNANQTYKITFGSIVYGIRIHIIRFMSTIHGAYHRFGFAFSFAFKWHWKIALNKNALESRSAQNRTFIEQKGYKFST